LKNDSLELCFIIEGIGWVYGKLHSLMQYKFCFSFFEDLDSVVEP
jgi:hypothetical protein